MSISTRVIRHVAVALAGAAIAAPGAQAASDAASREAATRESHWKHEDAMYDASRATSAALPSILEAHWKREDAQYEGRTAASGQPGLGAPIVRSGDGVDRLVMLTSAVGAAALLILGTVAATAVRRRHRSLA